MGKREKQRKNRVSKAISSGAKSESHVMIENIARFKSEVSLELIKLSEIISKLRKELSNVIADNTIYAEVLKLKGLVNEDDILAAVEAIQKRRNEKFDSDDNLIGGVAFNEYNVDGESIENNKH